MHNGAQFSDDSDSILASRPTYIVEIVLAITSILLGLYCVSPLYNPSVNTDHSETFQQSYTIRFVVSSVLFFAPGAITMLSLLFWKLKSNVWRRRASFFQFSGWSFVTSATIIGSGIYPITWLYTLALATCAGVCHFSTRAIIKQRGPDG